jgi:hypothetical protein
MGRDIYNIPKNNGYFTMVHVYVLVLVPTSGSGWEVLIFWEKKIVNWWIKMKKKSVISGVFNSHNLKIKK